ncbi:IS66 family insertion sequence element accessory protein TnpB [Vibrio splendidus]|uniref:IS66 family insertion sequence element accessory protein TnpB n=1 Tax=Vibrio splendidus TaxID=29497 RepID=UPI0009BD762F
MIHLTAQSHILIAIQPADFRCGIDGLAALCKQRLSQDPRNNSLFVFINRNRMMVRVLRRLWILVNDQTVIKRPFSTLASASSR